MNLRTLILRSLSHYWRWHLGLLAGVFLTAAIVSGALMVGDSVREGLRQVAENRLGKVRSGLIGGDRFFTEGLALRTGSGISESAVVAPVMVAQGTVGNAAGDIRANGIQILGVDDRFWALSGKGESPMGDPDDLVLGAPLATRLGVEVGDFVVARLELPGAISRDAPLSGSTDNDVTLRRRVTGIVDAEEFGHFGIRAEQVSPLNLFVPLEFLQNLLEKPGQANLMLSDAGEEAFGRSVEGAWEVADLELRIGRAGEEAEGIWEITSSRVFLDPVVEEAVMSQYPGAQGVVTYLVNEIASGEKSVPYSMATGSDAVAGDLAPGGAVINRWLADRLGAEVGDALRMEYFVVAGARELRETGAEFTVGRILEMDDPDANPHWTPEFPGVSDAENCRDWDPGIPIDLDVIGDEDEKYWDDYRGTPKVFIPLSRGTELWENRFGRRTAVRIPGEGLTGEEIEAALRAEVGLATVGMAVRDFAGDAESAVAGSFDLGGLFLSMSFFLLVTSLVLAALLFLFTVEGRSAQIGLLVALGVKRGRVRTALLVEAGVVAVCGAALGIAGGSLYAYLALRGLEGGWSGAVAGMRFPFHVVPSTLGVAFVATVFIGMLTVWLAGRKILKLPPRKLLAGLGSGNGQEGKYRPKTRRWLKYPSFWIGILSLAGAGSMLAWAGTGKLGGEQLAGAFYGAGSSLMITGICVVSLLLRRFDRPESRTGSVWSLGARNAVRRRGRSLAIVGMMAAGVFMVTAINAFRLRADLDAENPKAGTGGFRFVAESSLPLYDNLNTPEGREHFGLEDEEMKGVRVVPFRIREGDDASCLNLNRAQQPLLVGVNPSELAGRFTFASFEDGLDAEGWEVLNSGEGEDGAIPGVIDKNTALYALKKKIGDTVEYEDGAGGRFSVRLVGFVANSVLQGRVFIGEAAFVEKFPNAGGYRSFLIDSPAEGSEELARLLTRQMGSRGFEVTLATERLESFNAVQNTYLTIFSTLGGLGILLGTVGLGVLVARNVMERRSELGLMQAVGFRRGALLKVVLGEHWFLHVSGVGIGLGAALVAVWPMISEPGAGFPAVLVGGLVAGILVGGLAFCWIAGRLVLRGSLLDSIRSE